MERASTLSLALAVCLTILNQCPRPAEGGGDSGGPGKSCMMAGGVMGTCEEVGRCLQTGGVAMREGVVNVCSRDFSIIYVCCRRPHVIAEELCDAWRQYWRRDDGRCGVDHPLIIGGETADVGEFPHAVRVGKKYPKHPIHYECGGTLISPHFVLTAAHCLFSYTQRITFWVRLGDHDTEHDATKEPIERLKGPMPSSLYGADMTFDLANDTEDITSVEQVIEVEREYIYPHYKYLIYHYHDIALLKLKTPAKLTSRVLPACLPHQFPADDYTGETLTAVGWGSTESYRASQTLQKVKLPVMDRLSCSTKAVNFRKTPLGITEDMICAGGDGTGKDSCSGDSGGPLTFQKPRNSSSCEHTVVGVVSYGTGMYYQRCGSIGVYTRVSSYLDWITGYIAPSGTGYIPGENAKPVARSGLVEPVQNSSVSQNSTTPKAMMGLSDLRAEDFSPQTTESTTVTSDTQDEEIPHDLPIVFGYF